MKVATVGLCLSRRQGRIKSVYWMGGGDIHVLSASFLTNQIKIVQCEKKSDG